MGNETDDYIGCKATFRLKQGSGVFSAQIQNIDTKNKTVTFYKVTAQEDGKPEKVFGGLQQYLIDEIVDLKVFNEVNQGLRSVSLGKPVERNPLPTNYKKKGICEVKWIPQHLRKNREFDTSLLYMMNIVEEEMESTKDENGVYESKLPPDCTLIDDSQGKLFKEAMAHLKSCLTVGVAFEGINLGRNGELSWILVSTEVHTMFFDIKAMGKEGFDSGIRGFLQSPKVMKVIHDCRRPSDLLYYQYNTMLVNVFDTQVGTVLIFKALNDSFPRYVTTLADSLRNKLHLSDEDIHVPYHREHDRRKDEEVWMLRPAPSIVYDWMHRHSRHLVALQQRQMELLLTEFTLGVNIYLKNLRDLRGTEAEMRNTMQHLIPTEYEGLPRLLKAKLMEEEKKQRKIPGRYDTEVQKDEHGFVENWTGISHPMLIGSRDTIWHMHSNPSKKGSGNSRGSKKEPSNGTANFKPGNHSKGDDLVKDSQQSPVSSKEPELKNGLRNHIDSSLGTPTGSDKKLPSSLGDEPAAKKDTPTRPAGETPLVSAQEPPTTERRSSSEMKGTHHSDTETNQKDKVAALLSKAMREHKEKEKNNIVAHNMHYVFRPAGHEWESVSKKKQRQLQSPKPVSGNDLANKSVTSNSEVYQVTEDDFDAIPSHTKLSELRSQETASGPAFTPPEGKSQKTGGFDIPTFEEAIPPPPYYLTKETGKSCPQEALVAILPRVVRADVGSRSSVYCENGTSQSKSGGLLTNNHASPHHSASDSANPAEGSLRTSFRTHGSEKGFGTGGSTHSPGLTGESPVLSWRTVHDTAVGSNGSSPLTLSPPSTPRASQESGTSVSSSPASAAAALTVPSSAPWAKTVAETHMTSANGLSQPLAWNTESSSSSVASSSSPTASCQSPTPLTNVNGLSTSEIRKALDNGKSVISILGFKSPQERMMSMIKAAQQQK